MNTKSLIGAAVLAAALILIGLLAYDSGAPPEKIEGKGNLLFPELLDRINDVDLLVMTTSEGDFNIQRGDPAWTLAERGGYPVQMDKVRPTLIGLGGLERLEEKTSDPAAYVKLGVQAVGAVVDPENQSKQLTLKDASGETLASVIIGKTRGGGRGDSFYARRTADAASWLVKGNLPFLPEKGDDWLDKKILELQRTDIRSGQISHADGEVVTISKKDSETDYTLHELPEDRELKYASAANVVAGSMQYLNFTDVTPVAEFEKPEESVSTACLWTKDGMRVTAEVWEKDEKFYATFSAAYDLEGIPTLEIGPAPPPEEVPEEGEGEEGTGAEEVVVETEAKPRPVEEVQPEIDELNARLSGWVYEIPEYTKNNFAKRLEDMLKPLPEPETEEEGEAGEASIDDLGGPPVEDGGDDGEVDPPADTGTGTGGGGGR